MASRKIRYDFVNTETGCVDKHIYMTDNQEASIVIKNPKKAEYMKARTEFMEFLNQNQGAFVHLIYNYGKPIFEDILEDVGQAKGNTHIVRLLLLASYLNYKNNLYDNNNHRIKKSSLGKIWNTTSRNSINETFEVLTKYGYIAEEGGYIIMNSNRVVKGEVINFSKNKKKDQSLTYVRVFIDSLQELYNNSNAKARKQLAQFYKVLPYVHYEYNVVCHNPLEADENAIEPMTWTELAEICGIEGNKVTRLKKDLSFKINGEHVIGEFKNGPTDKKPKLVINPSLYYAGSHIEHLIGVMKLFKM